MNKVIIYDRQRLSATNLNTIQDNMESDIVFVLEDMLNYADFATGSNLECVPEDPISNTVVITAGAVHYGNKIARLLEDYKQVIDVPSVGDRYDIISATAALDEDEDDTIYLIDVDETEYTDTLPTREIYKITIHYTKDTEDVPEGHFPIAKIFVESTGGTYGVTEITDLRPAKDDSDLAAHIASVRATHADGSIDDQHIAADADIQTSKINGLTCADLETFFKRGLPMNYSATFTYGVDDEVTDIDIDNDGEVYSMEFSYTDDLPDTIDIAFTDADYQLAFTVVDEKITEINGGFIV